MIFGHVDNPSVIDFELPPDHSDTARVLTHAEQKKQPEVYVGCAKWNRT